MGRTVVIYTVGLANPKIMDYTPILDQISERTTMLVL